jgi:hypothetical protein
MLSSIILTLCFIVAVFSAESNLRTTSGQKPKNHYPRGQIAFDGLVAQLESSAAQHRAQFHKATPASENKKFHATGKILHPERAESEKNLMANEPEKETGYMLMRARPDSDCGGLTTFTSGILMYDCKTTGWANTWRSQTCEPIESAGQNSRYWKHYDTSTCSGNPTQSQQFTDYTCAFGGRGPYWNSWGMTKDGPGLSKVGSQCSSDVDAWRAKDGFQLQSYYINSCIDNTRPDSFRHVNFDACIVNVIYEARNDDDDDLDDTPMPVYNHLDNRRVAGYSYLKYHACNQQESTISLTEYSDAGCTRPIGSGVVQMPMTLDVCNNQNKYTCIDKNSPHPLALN